MAPYDKSSSDLPIVIANNVLGVRHSVRQQISNEFEVSILAQRLNHQENSLNSRISRWFTNPKKAKKPKQGDRQKRSVRFDEEIRFYRIPHRDDVTPEQKSLLWINYFDWQAMQKEKQLITRAVLIGHMSIDNPDHRSTLRGLETLVPVLALRRRENVTRSRSVVLREQTQARLEDMPLDVHRVAHHYAGVVEASRKAAYERAIEDYCEVLKDSGIGKRLAVAA